MMRTVLVAGFALVLAACGDAADLQPVKQGALDLGGQALEAASGAVDTEFPRKIRGLPRDPLKLRQGLLGSAPGKGRTDEAIQVH